VLVACRNRADDLFIVRSFRLGPLTGVPQLKPDVVGPSVRAADRCRARRFWHECGTAARVASPASRRGFPPGPGQSANLHSSFRE
jgi:hypothetical protein